MFAKSAGRSGVAYVHGPWKLADLNQRPATQKVELFGGSINEEIGAGVGRERQLVAGIFA